MFSGGLLNRRAIPLETWRVILFALMGISLVSATLIFLFDARRDALPLLVITLAIAIVSWFGGMMVNCAIESQQSE